MQTRMPALPVWAVIACGCSFLLLAALATGYRVVPGDRAIGRWAQGVPGPPADVAADSSNLLGDPLSSSLVVVALLVLCIVRRFAEGVVLCGAVLVSCVVGASLKLVFDSERPGEGEAILRDDHFVGVGFPSGHSLTVTLFAGAVTMILPALFGWTPGVRVVVALSWVWAAVCMFSRIWLGAHWFTDVAGGLTLGIVLLAGSARLANRHGHALLGRLRPRDRGPGAEHS